MRNLVVMGVFLLAFLFLLNDGQTLVSKDRERSNWTSDIILNRADSLLKAGNKNMAMELYFKSINMNRPYLPLVYETFKKIGEIYLRENDYQKAIYFFKEYEWMAEAVLLYSREELPDIDFSIGTPKKEIEVWSVTIYEEAAPLSDSAREALKKELAKFSLRLKELEKKYLKDTKVGE